MIGDLRRCPGRIRTLTGGTRIRSATITPPGNFRVQRCKFISYPVHFCGAFLSQLTFVKQWIFISFQSRLYHPIRIGDQSVHIVMSIGLREYRIMHCQYNLSGTYQLGILRQYSIRAVDGQRNDRQRKVIGDLISSFFESMLSLIHI